MGDVSQAPGSEPKNAQLQWTLPELRRVKQPKAVGEQQAMVVGPPLLSHLEDRISAMCKAGRGRQMDSSSGAVACGSGSPPVQAP